MDTQLEVLRELSEEDFLAPAVLPQAHGSTLDRVRGMHHAQARLIASGKKPLEVASALGVSVRAVQALVEDPTFQELVSYYSSQLEVVYMENHEKASAVGRLAMDLIHEKLENEGTKVPMRELKEVMESMFDRSDLPKKVGVQGGSAPTTITFNFGELGKPGAASSGVVIDHQAEG